MSHPGYPNALPVRAITQRLAEARAGSSHEFWSDDVSLLDPRVADNSRIHGPRQITNVYLLALAVRHGGQFVTLDAGVSREAAVGAEKRNLLVL